MALADSEAAREANAITSAVAAAVATPADVQGRQAAAALHAVAVAGAHAEQEQAVRVVRAKAVEEEVTEVVASEAQVRWLGVTNSSIVCACSVFRM